MQQYNILKLLILSLICNLNYSLHGNDQASIALYLAISKNSPKQVEKILENSSHQINVVECSTSGHTFLYESLKNLIKIYKKENAIKNVELTYALLYSSFGLFNLIRVIYNYSSLGIKKPKNYWDITLFTLNSFSALINNIRIYKIITQIDKDIDKAFRILKIIISHLIKNKLKADKESIELIAKIPNRFKEIGI